MLSQPVYDPTSLRQKDECLRTDGVRGLKSTTLLSMPPVPLFELHIFHPDTNTRTRLVNRALTYTTRVRSGGSQVYVGNRNHRAEPVSVLRRAPMNPSSDVFPPTPINDSEPAFQIRRES